MTKNNEKFDAYYKVSFGQSMIGLILLRIELVSQEQRIVPEEEWESMLNAFKEPLPTTFRLTGSRARVPDNAITLLLLRTNTELLT